jgi:hypothetical protein
MAGSFRYFRKHQRTFMAVAVLLAIGIFVFASALPGGDYSNGRRAANAPVASWRGGSLDEGQLVRLVFERRRVNEMLFRIYMEAIRNLGTEQQPPVPDFRFRPDAAHEQVESLVLNTEVMSDLARQSGIEVSDAVVMHYLREFGLGQVAPEEIAGILASSADGNLRANEAILFGTLRKILAAHYYQSSYQDSSRLVMPEQRWEDWRRVHDRLSVQAAVLPVANFVAQTGDPSDAEIAQLYDQAKSLEPDRLERVEGRALPAPGPGFAEPRQVRLQFVSGNLSQWSERFRDEITDQEIADYYERNKRSEFVKLNLPGDLSGGLDLDDESQDPGEQPEATEEPAAEPQQPQEPQEAEATAVPTPETESAADAQAPTENPSSEDANADAADADADADEPEANAADPEAGDADAGDADAGDADADTEVPSEPAEGDASERSGGDENQSSASSKPSPFRLVSLLQEDSPASDDDSDEDDVAVEDTAADDAAADDAADDDDADASAETADGESDEAPGVGAPATGAPAATDSAASSTEDGDDEEEEVEYEPLEDVRELIIDTLARDMAVQVLEDRIRQVFVDLQSEYNRYGGKVIAARETEQPAPAAPARLADLKQAVQGEEFMVEQTSLLSLRELGEETMVGRAMEPEGLRRPVWNAAFSSLELYEPLLGKDLDGNWYLVVKTEDKPQRIPPLEEIRDQVVDAWKQQEAFKLAEARAKELAEQVRSASQGFEEFFADRGIEVVPQTAMFSWVSYGMSGPGTGQLPSLSEAPPLEKVGKEFMETVFSLEDADVAATHNHDQTAAYVVRVQTRERSRDELKEAFLKEQPYWPGQIDMLYQHQQEFQTVLDKQLRERAELELDEDWVERRSTQE